MKRLSRNAAAILGSDVLRRLLGFAAVTYLARQFGAEGFGAINLSYTVLSYAIILSSAGLTTFGIREISRSPDTAIVGQIVGARLRSSAITFGVITIAVLAFVPSGEMKTLIILFTAAVFAHALLLDWYFQGREQMGIIGISRTLSAVLYLGLIIFAVRSPKDIYIVGLAALASDVLQSSILWSSYKARSGSISLSLTLGNWKALVQKSLPFGVGSILAQVSINFPTLALGILLTNQDVGVFSAASKLVVFLLMFDRLVATLLLPVSARIHATSPDALAPVLSLARKWIVIIGLPLCVGGALLAPGLMTLLYGPEFVASADVFRLVVWYVLFTLLHTIYTSGLLAIGSERIYAKIMAVSAIVYGSTTLAGILSFGAVGAAAAMSLSELVTLVISRTRFSSKVRMQWDRSLLMTTISAILMALVLLVAPPMHVLLAVIFGAGVYVALLFLLKAITLPEIIGLVNRLA